MKRSRTLATVSAALVLLAGSASGQAQFAGQYTLLVGSIGLPFLSSAASATIVANPTNVYGPETAVNIGPTLVFNSCPGAFCELDVAAGAPYGQTALFQTSNGLSAGGITQGTAQAITLPVSLFTTVGTPNGGGLLPLAQAGYFNAVSNSTTTPMQLFPNTSDAINGGGANASIILPAKGQDICVGITGGKWSCSIYIPPGTSVATSVGSSVNTASSVSTSLVMVGLGVNATWGAQTWSFTPAVSGRILINAGVTTTTQTAVQPFQLQLYCGTGTPPANGAAVTGTAIGITIQTKAPAVATGATVPITGVYAGTVGTASWCDLAYDTTNAADAVFIQSFNASFVEE